MTKNTIGLDISDSSIEAVVLEKAGRNIKVSAYGRCRLSPDIVSDGRILDAERLKDAIHKLLINAKPKSIEAKKVFLSIPESRTYTRVLSAPQNLKDKELREYVLNKAEEMIPEDPEGLKPVIKVLEIKGDFKEVLYMAAKKDTIDSLVAVFNSLNMGIEGICTEAVSSFAGLGDAMKTKTTLLLDIGARTSIATVFNKNGVRDTVNINLAGDHITEAIAKQLNVSMDEAEQKKEAFSFSAPSEELNGIIVGQLDTLSWEIGKLIKYYQERYNETIEQIILIGGSAQLKDVGQYFSNQLLLPVIIGQSILEGNSFPEPLAITKYINAVGLASFAYMAPEINFYSSAKSSLTKSQLTAGRRSSFIMILLIILLSLVILGTLFLVFRKPILERFSRNQEVGLVL